MSNLNEREIRTIKLSNDVEVDIITYLTWGEKEDLQAVMLGQSKMQATEKSPSLEFSGSAIGEARNKLLEISVKAVRINGVETKYSREWMRNLRAEDGETIYSAVDELSKKKV